VAPADRRHEIAGDLDAIVHKAMEKDPADRYGSVAELAADVCAHLEHLPVKARHPSFGYVARKLARRHRVTVAVAGGLAVLLAAGVAAVLWQARVAERERARAQQRFEQVRQLANYVIYDLQDGIGRLAGGTELRQGMVERSVAYLDSLSGEAIGDPGLQKELAGAYQRLGNILWSVGGPHLGDRDGSLRSLGKARSLLEGVVATRPADADARRALGRLLLDLSYFDDPALAKKALEHATAIWEDLVLQDPTHEGNLRGLASAHFSAFLTSKGHEVPRMEPALEMFQRLLTAKPDDEGRKRNVALCHRHLAGHFRAGSLRYPPEVAAARLAAAYQHAATAARLDAERLAARPLDREAKMDYSFDLSVMGDVHVAKREFVEALTQFERALTLRRELAAADAANVQARSRLAYMQMRMAELLVVVGAHARAVPLLKESVNLALSLPANEPSSTATLARAYLFLGEAEVAAGKDGCPSYRRMADLQPQVPELAKNGLYDPGLEEVRDRALVRLESCPRPG
jgi:tetratricopeptide (TPR) repeat protein